MCRDQFGYNGTVIEHVRFKNDPYVNASSFAIVSEGQVFPFPMPTYQNGNPRIPAGEHLSMIPQPYNEITWKDVSATSASGEMEIEATWTTLDGSPKRKNLTGRDEIGAFYKKIGEILAVLPADALAGLETLELFFASTNLPVAYGTPSVARAYLSSCSMNPPTASWTWSRRWPRGGRIACCACAAT